MYLFGKNTLQLYKRPVSLQSKLITVTVGLFLFFIWTLVFLSTTVLQTHLEHVLSDQQFSFAQRLASDIDNKLLSRAQSLSSIAENVPVELDPGELGNYLAQLKALHTMFSAGIAMIGLDGKTIADYPVVPGRRGTYYGDREYFTKVVQTKNFYIDKPIIGRVEKRPVLTIAAPVLDQNGELLGVMMGVIDLTAPNFLGIVSDSTGSGKGEFVIVSPRDKLVIASSETGRVMMEPPKRGIDAMYDRFVDGFEGSGISADAKGESRLFSAARIPTSGWIAMASLPVDVAFRPARAMREYLVIVAAGMTLLAFFMIQWMTRRILYPLEAAGQAMRMMTQNKMPLSPLPVKSRDEIGQLVDNFNSLVQDRQRYEAALAESEQRFRMLVESAPDAIFVQTDGRFAYLNEAAINLFGAKNKEELLGQPVMNRIHPDFQATVRERIRLLNEAGQAIVPLEEKYLQTTGAVVDVEVSAVPFRFQNVNGALVFVRNIAERKRIEKLLRMSEASLANAQRIARIGSWELDLISGEFFYSEELCRICGVASPQLRAGLPAILEIVHPDDRAMVKEAAIGAINEGRPYHMDFRILLPEGSEREVHVDAELVFEIAGNATRLAGTVQDITEKKLAERLLREREEQFRALVEKSPDLIIRFDRNFRCAYVNPAAVHAVGVVSDQLIGHTIKNMNLPESTATIWISAIEKVIITEGAQTFEFSLPTQSGVRYYQGRMVPEFEVDDGVQNVLVVARDISAIKGGEAVLRESELRIHGITANTPGMVFQCQLRARDGALMFTYVSEGSRLLLGLAPGEIQANCNAIAERLVQPDRDAFHDSLRYSALTMEVWDWEGRTIPLNGEEKWINCRATPRSARDGDVIWEGVMLNITDSKRNEDEIRQSRQLVRELSAHREMVREEERKRIAREVHDELGQALTALRMDVSLLRLNFGSQSPELMERIQSMRKVVDQTIQIVRHVTTSLRPVALDLGLTASLEWLVEEFAGRTGIDCALENAESSEVMLDDSRATALFRMVQESLTNVAKHADATKVRISIAVENDDTLCVKIRDNGRGFDQGTASRPGSFGLVGMRERALILQGTVDIQSTPGAGTRIEFCIPLHIQ